jgi:histone-lysine N-methyltransferase SETD1
VRETDASSPLVDTMTRPPPGGLSFAQFFPNAPKVRAEAHGRADDGLSSPASRPPKLEAEHSGTASPLRTADATPAASKADSHGLTGSSHGSQPSDALPPTHTDENHESSPGDLLTIGGSTSSHTSSASSIYSTPALTASSISAPGSSTHFTVSKDSPASSHTPTAAPANKDMLAPMTTGRVVRHTSHEFKSSAQNGVASKNHAERAPARDPNRSIKGVKCTYDPLIDRIRNKSVSKRAEPVYKEFGLVCDMRNKDGPFQEGGVISYVEKKTPWLTTQIG